MALSKSRFIDYRQCPKKLWLNTYRRELADEMDPSRFTMGTKVGILARDLFPGGVLVEYDSTDRNNIKKMLSKTEELIKNKEPVIYEAAFSDGDTLAICDILVSNGRKYDIYEVKASARCKDVHVEDLAFQTHVLESCGIQVGRSCLVHINNLYTRYGELDIHQLFAMEDLTSQIKEMKDEIESDIEEAMEILEDRENGPEKDIGMHCTNPYECQFIGHCYGHIPDNSIFDISGLYKSRKFRLYRDGIISFRDIMESSERLSDSQMLQVESELNDTEKIDGEAIREFLDTLWYPLYFLDFETINSAIPLYDGTRPYQQVPTQYSLHYVEHEGAELKHTEFLAGVGEEPRKPLAEHLADAIPPDACVLAYNMTFEKSVIGQLAAMFPDLQDRLLPVIDNVRDLMIPFQNKWVYKKEMKGSYSIKAVLPALFPDDSELSYKELDGVSNGQEASLAYISMTEMSPVEQESVRRQLLEYCKLDTLAMVRLWEWMRKNIR